MFRKLNNDHVKFFLVKIVTASIYTNNKYEIIILKSALDVSISNHKVLEYIHAFKKIENKLIIMDFRGL